MKLEEKLVEVINQAQKAGAEAFLFTKEQAPDIINQLLIWKFWDNVTQSLMGLVLLCASLYCLFYGIREEKRDRYNDIGIPIIIISGMVGALSAIVFLGGFLMALKIYLAPKVYLLEYAASLINK